MSINQLTSNLVGRGFEHHGRCHGRSGNCYIVFSKRGQWDYGDKECRLFQGFNVNNLEADSIYFKFSMSRSALATDKIVQWTKDPEQFLKNAGFNRFRMFLLEDDTPGRKDEVLLTTQSSRDEYTIYEEIDISDEVYSVKIGILELLWNNRFKGAKRTPKQDLENHICTNQNTMDSVLDSLERRGYIKGAYGSSGIKITTDGEIEIERLQGDTKKPESTMKRHRRAAELYTEYDIFISHASEDKEEFVRPLAEALQARKLKVWYDEFTLKLGDSLRRSIDKGLVSSRFGIVVLSKYFFEKEWPQRELDGLVAKEISDGKTILPVWHGVSKEDVANYSLTLADRVAVSTDKGLEKVLEEIVNAIDTDEANS